MPRSTRYVAVGSNSSKSVLNVVTRVFAKARDCGIEVNTVDPGYTLADANGPMRYDSTAVQILPRQMPCS